MDNTRSSLEQAIAAFERLALAWNNQSTKPAAPTGAALQDDLRLVSGYLTELRRQAVPSAQQALEAFTDSWYHLDSEWRFIEVSEAAVTYFQRKPEELLGCCIWDVFPSARGSIYDERFHQAAAGRKPVHFETSFSDDTLRYIEVLALPVEMGLVVYFRDLTSLKKIEQNLNSTSKRLNLTLERINDGYIAMDTEGHFLEVNQTAEEDIFLRPAAQLLGKFYHEVQSAVTGAVFQEQFQCLVTGGQPVHFETQSDDHRRWFEVDGYPRGEFVEFYLHEITDRKQAEEEIRSIARFPEENPYPVLRISRDGILLFANRSSQNLIDLWNCRQGEQVTDALRQQVQAALKDGHKHVSAVQLEDRWFSMTFMPVKGSDYVNVYGHEITERVQVEETLRQSEAQLRESRDQLQGVLNSITEAYFVLDDAWRIVDFNHVAEREFLGQAGSALIGKVFWELFPAAIGNDFYHQYHTAFETGQPVHFEALSGLVPFWYEVHAYPRNGRLEIYLHNINERKQAEQERERLLAENRRQKALLEAIFHSDPTGIALVSATDLTFLMANPTYRGFTPNPEIDPVGRPSEEIWPPEQGFQGVDIVRRVLDTGEPYRLDRFVVETAGQKRTFSVFIQRLEFEGEPAALVVTWEITGIEHARSEAEDALLRAEAAAARALQRETELETVVNAMTEAVTIVDSEGRIVRTNTAAIRYYGMDLSGKSRAESAERIKLSFPDGSPMPEETMPVSQALRGEVVTNQQLRFTSYSGEVFDVVANASPLYLSGNLVGAVLVWRDVTERERLHRQLQLERSRLEAILQQMPAGIMILDAASEEIVMANQRINEIWRLPEVPPDFLGKRRLSAGSFASGKPYLPENWPILRAVRAGETVQSEEIHIQRGDRTDAVISTSAAPVFDYHGNVVAGVSVIFDITERKQVEQNKQFLAGLGERLLELTSPDDVRQYASRALGEYLGASFCSFDEVDQQSGTITVEHDFHPSRPSLAGTHPFTTFHEQAWKVLSRSGSLILNDVMQDPSIEPEVQQALRSVGIRAFAAFARIKEGRWASTLTLAFDSPHTWHSSETELLRSAADLVWLALEGANVMQNLRLVTERFNVALKNAPVTVFATDMDLRYTWVHKSNSIIWPEEIIGKRHDEVVPVEAVGHLMEMKKNVLQTGKGLHDEVRLVLNGREEVYDITIEPMRGTDGKVNGVTVAAIDITGLRRLEAEVRESTAQIEIQRQILHHRELERVEIARDLHDGPLQNMIGLSFAMNEMTTIDKKELRLARIREIQESLQEQIRDVRAYCSELRPPALAPFGLEKAIRSHVTSVVEKNPGMQLHLDMIRDGKALPEEIRMVLFRVYQEAANNITRHAGAKDLWIHFGLDEHSAWLEIRDNGKGFELPRQWVSLAREGHLGLVGMHERVQAVNGTLKIESKPGKGTKIRVTVPRQ